MKPSTWSDLRQGIRVRCIFSCHGATDKMATVMKADRCSYPGILVSWDGDYSGPISWGSPGSFEVIEG